MEKLKVFETFSGIGAQHKAITRRKLNYEVVATSEWDIDAIICYDAIHHGSPGNYKECLEKYSSLVVKNGIEPLGDDYLDHDKRDIIVAPHVNSYLENFSFSRDGENLLKDINKLALEKRIRLAIANMRNNNLGSIMEINGEDIGEIDVLTYSFPCQDLSIASMGRGKGMAIDSNSRSSLLWQIGRIIEELEEINKLPKYLLLENVEAMLNKTNYKDYEKWIKHLESYGYKTNAFVLNAMDFGIPQPRKRVFAISVLGKENTIKMEDFVERHKEFVGVKEFIDASNSNLDRIEEYNGATPNNTESRRKMYLNNPRLNQEGVDKVRTITKKQDRHPNAGMIEYINNIEGKSQFRFLTPRECYRLMGFDDEDFDNVKNEWNRGFTRKERLYAQAGNSIVVNILEEIFEVIEEHHVNGK